MSYTLNHSPPNYPPGSHILFLNNFLKFRNMKAKNLITCLALLLLQCLIYTTSLAQAEDPCEIDPTSIECLLDCENNPTAPECGPCLDDPISQECLCLLFPEIIDCLPDCESDPTAPGCEPDP